MHKLGNYIVSSRMKAIGVISFLTIISLLLPPLAYPVSGVPAALVVLRRGAVVGIEVIAGSLFLTLLLTLLMRIPPYITLVFALGVWLPLWCSSVALRSTESQGLMVLTAGAIGMLFIVLISLAVGDTSAWWKNMLEIFVETHFTAEQGGELKQILETLAPMMNALIASGIVISLVVTTLFARWWQSMLFHPGEFRREFHQLRLPRSLIYPTLIGILVLIFFKGVQQSILRDLLVVVLFLYLFHGIAAVHRMVRAKDLSSVWLVGMYGLVLLLPQMVMFMACIGMVDSWIGSKKSPGNGNNPG